MYDYCTRDVYWSSQANQLAPAQSTAAASGVNTNTPLVCMPPVWIAGCTANWANKLSTATVGSR